MTGRAATPVRQTALALLALAALAAVFYAPILFGGRTLLLRDLFTQFQGPRWWYRQSLQAGEIPYWNPYIGCGVPFLANPQNGVFYPLSLIFLLLPFGAGLAVYAAVHSVLLGFFSYLLGRTLGLAFWGALLAGIIAGFAGIPLKQVEFLELAGGLAWTPLVLLGGWKCLAEPGARWSALLGAALGLQLLAGSPYPPLYSALGLACAVVASIGTRGSRRGAGYLCLGGALGLFIGCAQYVPTLLLVRGVPAEDMKQIMQASFSLRWRDLAGFLSPWLAGFPNWQKCFSVGVAAVFFVFAGLRPRRPAAPPSGFRFGFCLLLVLAGMLFAAGHAWGFDRLIAALPLIRRAAKWPTMGLSLTIIGGSLLAGAGLQRWLDAPRPARAGGWLAWLAPLGAFALLLALDAARGGPALAWVRDALREPMVIYRSPSLAHEGSLGPEAARLALAAALLAALVGAGLWGASRRVLAAAACLLVAAELFSANHRLNFQSPADLYAEAAPPELRPVLGAAYETGSARVLVPDAFSRFSDLAYGSTAPDEFRILRQLFNQDTVMSWRVFTTQGGGSVGLPDYQYKLQPLLDALAANGTPAARGVLGAWNITLFLQGSLDGAGLHCQAVPNDRVLPRARLVERVVSMPTAADALGLIANNRWDPSTMLVAWDQQLPDFPAIGVRADGAEPGSVANLQYDPSGIRVSCDLQRPCFLVLAENWAEGWSARVDGVPAALYRVNFLQQAVRLTPGRHEVTWRYVAPGAHLGLLLSALGLGGLAGCALIRRKP